MEEEVVIIIWNKPESDSSGFHFKIWKPNVPDFHHLRPTTAAKRIGECK